MGKFFLKLDQEEGVIKIFIQYLKSEENGKLLDAIGD